MRERFEIVDGQDNTVYASVWAARPPVVAGEERKSLGFRTVFKLTGSVIRRRPDDVDKHGEILPGQPDLILVQIDSLFPEDGSGYKWCVRGRTLDGRDAKIDVYYDAKHRSGVFHLVTD